MDDLKALRDEIGQEAEAWADAGDHDMDCRRVDLLAAKIMSEWAARLTSIIERNEKERAVINAAISWRERFINDEPSICALEDWELSTAVDWLLKDRALTERAKEPSDG